MERFLKRTVRFGCRITFVMSGILLMESRTNEAAMYALCMIGSTFVYLLVGNPNKKA